MQPKPIQTYVGRFRSASRIFEQSFCDRLTHRQRRGASQWLPNRTGEALNARSRDHLLFLGLVVVSEDEGGACRHGAGRGNGRGFSSTPTRFAVKSERDVSDIASIGYRDRRQGRNDHRRRRERCALASARSQRVRTDTPILSCVDTRGHPDPMFGSAVSLVRSVPTDGRSRIRNGQTPLGASLGPAEPADSGQRRAPTKSRQI
jgi:hypothetical protein